MLTLFAISLRAGAAPYAAMVMDARSGEVLHSRNADTRLHPASLTKMMTLYVAFEAVRLGEISMDTKIKVSKKAASEPPSKLGLKSGQRISLRYLVRAAAVKSGNDAATAIAEGISGSEAAFARRMNRTAKALGMTRTTFKNAHGLTEAGHLSTARDMTIMGRRLFYDYPKYYNLFSRLSTHAGVRNVPNTNRRFLSNYKGADGIKTGYTRAAGFNLVASAERGRERIITTVFGGRSTATRNAKVAELMDLGFRRAPSRVAVRKPALPRYNRQPVETEPVLVARTADDAGPVNGLPRAVGKTLRIVRAPKRSMIPHRRPKPRAEDPVLLAMQQEINQIVAQAAAEPLQADAKPLAAQTEEPKPAVEDPVAVAVARPDTDKAVAEALAATEEEGPSTFAPQVSRAQQPATAPLLAQATQRGPKVKPLPRPKTALVAAARLKEPVVVTRVSTSGGRHWGVSMGKYPSRHSAERALLTTALKETQSLDGALRKIVQQKGGFEANFVGMSQDQANRACQRLAARGSECSTFGPG
ncbi:serine hydrolase [Actibacterium sp. 188UL27-1]|uniref:serine hydrolase n=1 Tax=Actibacterium sp. 188UL27-1 TaxID=2786961 RepID=UPI00195E1040|nr:serine hydrolase [Actibacterium sp. 188UL27-1]MBM7069480.1 serine hydrolase [Actibacterium sp. 188UL27-1]